MLKARTIVTTLSSLALVAAAHAQAPIGWQVAPAELSPPKGITGETWGFCTAMDDTGSLIAVGAPNARVDGVGGVGKVYIYERDAGTGEWNLVQTLEAPPLETGEVDVPYEPVGFAQFGCSVAIQDDTLVVGSWGWTGVGDQSFAGRAFVYTRDGGTFGSTVTAGLNSYDIPEAVLRPNDRSPLDLFGYDVAIDFDGTDGTIVVGKQLGEGPTGQSNAGSAYVFEGSGATWTQVAKLTAGDAAAANDNLGEQVAVRGGTVVIGCPKHDGSTGSTNSGTVFVFERPSGGWAGNTVPTASIRASDGSSNDNFGASVDLLTDSEGTLIAVGSPGYDRDESGQTSNGNGASYLYTGSGSTWSELDRVFARESNGNNAFGFAVAVAGSFNQPSIIVGSPGYEGSETLANTGAAFNFVGNAGAVSLFPSDLWIPSAPTGASIGRTVAHRRIVDGSIVIRAVVGSEYPLLSPKLYVFDFSPAASGPDYPTKEQIAAGVPPFPDAPGADGTSATSTTGSPSGGGLPAGGIGGGTSIVIPLTPIQADFGLVIGTVMVTNGNQLLGFQTDGRNARSKSQAQPIGTIPTGWTYLAAPDINGDRGGDPLFTDVSVPASPKVRAWLRDGLSVIGQREVAPLPAGYQYLTFGKLNDGQTDDIVWQDGDEAVVWFIADGAIENEARIPLEGADPLDPSTFSGWEATITDIDTDNAFELVLRKPGVGTFLYRVSDDGTEPVQQELPDQGPGFTLLGAADMDGENASDLVWHDLSRDAPYFSYLRVTQDNLGNEIIVEDGGRDWPLSFGGITPVEVRDLDSNGTGDFILQIGSDAIIFLTEIKSTDSGFSYLGTAYRRNLGEVPGGGTVRGFGVR